MSSSSSAYSSPSSRTSSIDSRQGLHHLIEYPRGARPVYSYHTLVRGALLDAPNCPLTAKQVWEAICTRFPFFRTERGASCRSFIINTLSNTPCFLLDAKTPQQTELYWTYNPNLDIHLTNSKLSQGSSNESVTTLVNIHYQWDKENGSVASSGEQRSESDGEDDKNARRGRGQTRDRDPSGDLFQEINLGMHMEEERPSEQALTEQKAKCNKAQERNPFRAFGRGRSQRRKKASIEGIPFPELLGDTRPSRRSSQQSREQLPFHPRSSSSAPRVSRSTSRSKASDPPTSQRHQQPPQHRSRHPATVPRRNETSSPAPVQRHVSSHRLQPSGVYHNAHPRLQHESSQEVILIHAQNQSSATDGLIVPRKPYTSTFSGQHGSTITTGGVGEDVNPEVEKMKRRERKEKVHGYGSGFGYEQRVDEGDQMKEKSSFQPLRGIKNINLKSLSWRKRQDGCCIIA